MALRFSEEPAPHLSPREAREFLRIHAEREARVAAADAPTVNDLAETLGITAEEARSILQEARARTAPQKAKPRTARQQEARIATIILGCAGVALACFLIVAPSPRVAPAPAIFIHPISPTPVLPPAPTPEFAPSPGAFVTPMTYDPPAGFQVEIETPTALLASSAVPQAGADPRSADELEAANLRERLAQTAESMIASGTDERGLSGARAVSVFVRTQDGRRTRLVVPLPILTPPFRNDPQARAAFHQSLLKVLQAAWPQIVRP